MNSYMNRKLDDTWYKYVNGCMNSGSDNGYIATKEREKLFYIHNLFNFDTNGSS